MAENSPEQLTIKLNGDWSMTGITQQLPPLTEHLATLSGMPPQQAQPVVDLEDVALLDASGCQLLTILLRHLKLLGFSPLLTNVPGHFRDSIELLGFGHEFETILDVTKGHA